MTHYVFVGLANLLPDYQSHQLYQRARAMMSLALQVSGVNIAQEEFLSDDGIRKLIRQRRFGCLLYDMSERQLVAVCAGSWQKIASCVHILPVLELILPGSPAQPGQEAWRREQARFGVMCSVWHQCPQANSFVWADRVHKVHTLTTLKELL